MKKKIFFKTLSLFFFYFTTPNATQAQVIGANADAAQEELAASVGTQTTIYGTAIMTEYYFRNRMKTMIAASLSGKQKLKFSENVNDGLQFNEFAHVQSLTTHEAKSGTSPNEDTYYSICFLNLKEQPQVLSLPEIKDRYFSVQVVDAYLENQEYICSRLGNVNGGKFLFVDTDWKGKNPEGMEVRRMPHTHGLLIIRILIKNKITDVQNVVNIQNGFHLESLAHFKGEIKEDKLIDIPTLPKPEGLAYYQLLLDFMQENPPLKRDEMLMRQMEMVGLRLDGTTQVESLSEPIKKGLLRGLKSGKEIVQWKIEQGRDISKSNWIYTLGAGSAGEDFLLRASWAIQGLVINSKEEAIYANCYFDKEGERLDGANNYEITIPKDKLAPVNAFWSLTSYDDHFDFVPTPFYHYSVGDRQEGGINLNADGSVTIKLQPEPPAEGLKNWLPIPKDGNFKLNFRFYNPKEILFDKTILEDYLPPVIKVPKLDIGDKTENGGFRLSKLLFKQGKSDILLESYHQLDQLVKFLENSTSIKIRIEGHTDNSGIDELNQKLSRQRASTIRDYLISKGIAADRLEFKGYGSSKPLLPNDSEENRAKNRRVEYIIL